MSAARIFAGSMHFAALACVISLALHGCAKRAAVRTPVPPVSSSIGSTESGTASWYGEPYHGRRAASGEIYDMEQLTAAHRTLPFQTWVEVTNLTNRRRVAVRITDRGPFVEGRIIDLSLAAARELDMVRAGIAPVELRIIPPPNQDVAAAEEPGYAVQAGAFSDRARAESFRASLPFPDSRVVRREGDPALWRVVVGHGLNMDAATRLAGAVAVIVGQSLVVLEP